MAGPKSIAKPSKHKSEEKKPKTKMWNQPSGLLYNLAVRKPGSKQFHSLGEVPTGAVRGKEVGKGSFKRINRCARAAPQSPRGPEPESVTLCGGKTSISA